MFFTQISTSITFCIVYFFFNCSNISFYCLCFYCYILLLQSSSSNDQPFFITALAWSHTCCSVDSNIPLSLHYLNILFLYHIIIGFPSSSNSLLLQSLDDNRILAAMPGNNYRVKDLHMAFRSHSYHYSQKSD